MNLNIMMYGDDFRPSGCWLMAEAYRRRGHSVQIIKSDLHLEKYKCMIWRIYRKFSCSILEKDRRRHVNSVINMIIDKSPDIVIVHKGVLFELADIRRMKSLGAWVVNYNYDDFYSCYRSVSSRIQNRSLSEYDLLIGTKKYNIPELFVDNQNSIFVLHAYEPLIHRADMSSEDDDNVWCVDVVFVGTWAAHRALMLKKLVQAVPAKYAIYGSDWNKLGWWSVLRRYVKGGAIYDCDLARALGGAKIALAFLRKENRDDYTTRTFEIPACGGVMLAERTFMHTTLFTENVDIKLFDSNDADDLIAQVRLLLLDNMQRDRLRYNGRQTVQIHRHSYDDRVEEIINIYINRYL